ncbi:isoprenoid synthase domain-containing protein [Mycena sanguinolenta]|nr:isoprenoid synthase domain-containing protein [Mycena sanguinolenta]
MALSTWLLMLVTHPNESAHACTIADYDLYCHYVAGLVGEGLSLLFSASGKESPYLASQLELSNNMGILLQKTNITRDFAEDFDQERFFWRREIWAGAKHGGGFARVEDMRFPPTSPIPNPGEGSDAEQRALHVLNAMVLDALRYAPGAQDYLRMLKNQSVFNFVAIPATTALATLELCFANPKVLRQNVKIRKAMAASLIMRSTNPREVAHIFREYARKIHARARPEDPNFIGIGVACGKGCPCRLAFDSTRIGHLPATATTPTPLPEPEAEVDSRVGGNDSLWDYGFSFSAFDGASEPFSGRRVSSIARLRIPLRTRLEMGPCGPADLHLLQTPEPFLTLSSGLDWRLLLSILFFLTLVSLVSRDQPPFCGIGADTGGCVMWDEHTLADSVDAS